MPRSGFPCRHALPPPRLHRCSDGGCAARACLSVCAGLPRPGGPAAATAAALHTGGFRACVRGNGRPVRRRRTARLVHPCPGRRTGAGCGARPRLGIGAGPGAAQRAVPQRGRVPLPRVRCSWPRREPGRSAAGHRRRIRGRRRCRSRRAARAVGGHVRRVVRPFDGRRRRDPGCRGGPASGGPRGDGRALRPASTDAPHVPTGRPADPRSRRVPAGVADDACLPPAAGSSRGRRQCTDRDRAL